MFKEKSWWPLLLTLVWIGFAFGKDLVFESVLLVSSKQAMGRITEAPLQHNTCRYALRVDEKAYNGTGYDCGHLEVGDQTSVYYWPIYPVVASTRYPGDTWLTNVLVAIAALFVGTLVSIFRKPEDD